MRILPYLGTAAIAAAAINPSISQTLPACPLINSTYESRGPDNYKISFVRLSASAAVMNDIALHLRSSNSSVERWYYFDGGSARRVPLISTLNPTKTGWKSTPDAKKPYGNVTYIALAGNGTISEIAPKANDRAPEFIIIPEMAQVLAGLSPPFNSSAFKFVKCG